VLLELPLALVLQPTRLAIVIAEAGDCDIEIAIAVEIRGTGISDSRHAIGDVVGGELLPAVVLEHDHRADAVVVGEQEAKCRNEQIEIAVVVDIDDFDMGGSRDTGNRLLGIGAARRLTHPADDTTERVTDYDVVQAVTIEIGDGHVRDLRPLLAFRGIADRARGEQRGRASRRRRGSRGRCCGRLRLASATRECDNDRRDRHEETDQGQRTIRKRARLRSALRRPGRRLRNKLLQ
jgi:hypothetical protein